jgi:hypothetical protein
VSENRVLRRIFGPKRDEVTGGWKKLHNEELHICTHLQILLGTSNQGESGGWDVHGRVEESVQGFDGKPEGNRPL